MVVYGSGYSGLWFQGLRLGVSDFRFTFYGSAFHFGGSTSRFLTYPNLSKVIGSDVPNRPNSSAHGRTCVSHTNVPKWHLSKWKQRLNLRNPSCLILSHTHISFGDTETKWIIPMALPLSGNLLWHHTGANPPVPRCRGAAQGSLDFPFKHHPKRKILFKWPKRRCLRQPEGENTEAPHWLSYRFQVA